MWELRVIESFNASIECTSKKGKKKQSKKGGEHEQSKHIA
jgi:hypothetical protein